MRTLNSPFSIFSSSASHYVDNCHIFIAIPFRSLINKIQPVHAPGNFEIPLQYSIHSFIIRIKSQACLLIFVSNAKWG